MEVYFLDPKGVRAIIEAGSETETITLSREDFATVVRALELAYRNGALTEQYDLSLNSGELIARIGNTKGILFEE